MKIDENEFFRRASMAITSNLDIQKAVERAEPHLRQYMPISSIGIGLWDPLLKVGWSIAAVINDDIRVQTDTVSFSKREFDFLLENWSSENWIRIVNGVETDDKRWREWLFKYVSPESSILMMDVKLQQKKMGSLFIVSKGKRQYTEYHAHLVSLLQTPLSIALHNYMIHHEVVRLHNILTDDRLDLQREMVEVSGDNIVGKEDGLKQVMNLVQQVAPLNSPVLLLGETGVGKEVVANAIHAASQREDKPFIKVNCGAIPGNLIESELFGHEKGAFTGATARKRGRFERAHTGTIFLDEIGELPLPAQVSLLRVIQQLEIERVGGSETIPVDVRIISASNRNLLEMVHSGEFREDLWFRLNVIPIIIPPLRQRVGDIPALINHFLRRKCHEMKIRETPSLAPGAMNDFLSYNWPGNVRELENLVERALILHQITGSGKQLTFNPPMASGIHAQEQEPKLSLMDSELVPLDEMVRRYIIRVLDETDGKIEGEDGAARILNMHHSTLRSRMRKLGIPFRRKGGRPAASC